MKKRQEKKATQRETPKIRYPEYMYIFMHIYIYTYA